MVLVLRFCFYAFQPSVHGYTQEILRVIPCRNAYLLSVTKMHRKGKYLVKGMDCINKYTE